MTHIVIKRKEGKIVSILADGHSGFAEEGEDIVCSAISSIIQTAVLGILQIAQIPADYKKETEFTRISLTLPEKLDPEDRINADMILETMALGIQDLSEEYGKFVSLRQVKV